MELKIIVDDSYLQIFPHEANKGFERKRILGVANGFEDGAWRSSDFHAFIWDNVGETALTERERKALAGRHYSAIERAARNLRLTDSDKDVSRGSELAEIVLYGIMRRHFGALSVVPKIFYKQNDQDNAKGADSVHIVLDKDEFTLWFGEAKFYNSIEDARLKSVIASVEESLSLKKLKKENSIITNIGELDYIEMNDNLRVRIKAALSADTSIDEIKPRLHIPILLLHECAITAAAKEWSDDYRDKLRSFHSGRAHSYFSKQVELIANKVTKYKEITFHLILFPVPVKEEIVAKFLVKAKNYKES